MLFKQVTLCLVSLMSGFGPEMDCLEGVMYGGGFVQGGFVRKWLMSRGSYVWRGFCPRVFCPEGVLSAHHIYIFKYCTCQWPRDLIMYIIIIAVIFNLEVITPLQISAEFSGIKQTF